MQNDFFQKWVSQTCASWRRFGRTLGCFMSFLIFLIAVPSMASETSSVTFLHANGRDIINGNGDKIILRGVGLGNWMLPEGYMWKFGEQGDRPRRIEKIVSDLIGPEQAAQFWLKYRKNYITEADIHRIAALGYNSVRPALNARLFLTESDPPQPVKEGYELLDNLVKWCKANGVYVIIDMHAAPGGQTGQNIDDSIDDQPELFMHTKYQDRLVNLWVQIAKRYCNEPTVAGYDLLNEPLPARTGAEAKYKDQLEPLYQRITKAIRKVDSKHMIILEGADWANDWSVFTHPFDSNLVYQFHYYCWDSPVKLKSIQQYLDFGRRFNVPIWVGETGESDAAIYWATTEYFEANNIGWSFWPWKKMEAANGLCSIKAPAQWNAVAAYSRGGDKPSRTVAQKAFAELLTNICLSNCIGFPDIANAMLRRVPIRIEAENYGQHGQDISYFVSDTNEHSQFYREDEPVKIVMNKSTNHGFNRFVSLNANEWTAYTVDCQSYTNCEITLRARAEIASSEAQLDVDGHVWNIKIPPGLWTTIVPGTVRLDHGLNHIKWLVKKGSVDLDWINVGGEEQRASNTKSTEFKGG